MRMDVIAAISRVNRQIAHAHNGSSSIAEVNVNDLALILEYNHETERSNLKMHEECNAYMSVISNILEKLE